LLDTLPCVSPPVVADRPKRTFALRLSLALRFSLAALVAGVSALEGWHGRGELFGDDISYLDVANMLRAHRWKAAFSPLWSIGYPALLTLVRTFFPTDIRGEMRAVFSLNLVISLASYFAFLWLLKEILHFEGRRSGMTEIAECTQPSPLTLVAATFAFLTAAIGWARVSSIGPDLLVAGLFFAASALMLRLMQRPRTGTAVLLAVVLAAGFLVKAFFLMLALIFLRITLSACRRHGRHRPFVIAGILFPLLIAPYVYGLSWAWGHPSLGEAGALNYAYHVNGLPHWMGWQGGAAAVVGNASPDGTDLGTPIHPVRLLRTDPAVFAFGEPFHVTYPPQFNLPYWYQGYRHFISARNTARAVFLNLRSTAGVLSEDAAFVLAVLLCASLALWIQPDRRAFLRRSLATWPWTLPSLLSLALYLLVHVESRYIAGFLAVLALVPFVALDIWVEPAASDSPAARPFAKHLRAAMLVLLVLGGSASIFTHLRGPFEQFIHRTPVQTEGEWRVARFLTAAGLRPGDKVADVSAGNDIRCAWAYGARLHIVAAIGNDAYNSPQQRLADLHRFFDDPATQRDVLELFRQQGAIAVVAPSLPFTTTDPGWQHIPGTPAWVLLLR
jgi:hypothetical protein